MLGLFINLTFELEIKTSILGLVLTLKIETRPFETDNISVLVSVSILQLGVFEALSHSQNHEKLVSVLKTQRWSCYSLGGENGSGGLFAFIFQHSSFGCKRTVDKCTKGWNFSLTFRSIPELLSGSIGIMVK